MKVKFLGNGDSLGTPRVYCDCRVCKEARTTGRNRRLRSAVWLEEEGEKPLLLDCGPDWRAQMEASGVLRVEQALLTHAHFDHIGGVTEWADACRWLETTADVFAPEEVVRETLARFPWIGKHLIMKPNDGGLDYGHWRIVPWRVNHGKNGYSYAYRFEHRLSGKVWAYCSDAINLTEAQKAPLRQAALLVLGTSYAEEPFPMDTRSVYDIKEGLALAQETEVGEIVFTHLSHDVDVDLDYGLPSNAKLSRTGMTLDV